MPEPIIIKSSLSPGDIMTMTAAIKSLHDLYPEKYSTDIRTRYPEIWANNPFVSQLEKGRTIDLGYPSIQKAGDTSTMFLQGYMHHLEDQLGVKLRLTTNRPDLYFTEDELKSPPFPDFPRKYIVFNAGVKRDYTAKQWPVEHYQAVVNHFSNRIPFIQIGKSKHIHHPIEGAINLIDKTTTRQLLQLCLHSVGGLCSVTFLQHIMAGVEKPCVVILGGRENVSWVSSYPYQTTLHRIGSSLPCCNKRACWVSRVVPLHDDKILPNSSMPMDKNLCQLPVTHTRMPIAKCMYDISPNEAIQIIESYL